VIIHSIGESPVKITPLGLPKAIGLGQGLPKLLREGVEIFSPHFSQAQIRIPLIMKSPSQRFLKKERSLPYETQT
jgi:hypothetical protein